MSVDQLHHARLVGLLSAAEALGAARSRAELIEVIRRTTRRLVGSDGITVVLRDGAFCHYIEEDAIAPLWKGGRFPAESCISGWAMIERATAIVPDAAADPRVPWHLYRETFVRSLVMVPILAPDGVGAIGAYWSEPHELSPEAIGIVEALDEEVSSAQIRLGELRHRLKNTFAVAGSLARLTLAKWDADRLAERLVALDRLYDLIDRTEAAGDIVDLHMLAKAVLSPYAADRASRVEIDGPALLLSRSRTTELALVLNELATNALKYGSLSSPDGVVAIEWHIHEAGLTLTWIERGGPAIDGSPGAGFGSTLLNRLIEGSMRGRFERILDPAGLICRIAIPLGEDAVVRARVPMPDAH